MASEVRKSDIGTIFRATLTDQDGTVVDISAASTKQLKFRKPDGTVLEKAATLTTDGTDGKMQYATISGDLNLAGQWKVQGYVVIGSGTWHTDEYVFTVHTNLS